MPLHKIAIRRQMLERRRELSTAERQTKSQAIVSRAIALPQYQANNAIAAYYPTQSEVDCLGILMDAHEHHKKCYIPILSQQQTKKRYNRLHFSLFDPEQSLSPNRAGILEPPSDPKTRMSARKLSLVFVPLVAFDDSGNRLGTGGGYYDRTFDWLKDRRLDAPTCLLIGLAFDCQEFPALPVDTWDVSLDAVVTESRTLWFI